ncbi:MAG: CBS domain-containing protein [candidate division KSB1 bacterium]|nr:CBS domain-containing protein [candidate division KSB1 bacterium]MDZ7273714.1 CBS domain-containing protein [candidate division KSB1 bacterium]MDZ7285870.1 CBS domain-containing protein [candidate division KSB1 bacterium]MDZ7298902.1 CBS domain-containing protein [candidate division KSB1 bacterium]MDZ7309470.1 CBS domain-containing protein [candidate division KSB1 bacterium]
MDTVGNLVAGREVYTVQAGQSIYEVVHYMVEKNVGAVAVLEGDRVVGIFSERDLMKRVVAPELKPREVPVKEVMTRNLITAAPQESYETCLARMQKHSIRHLVVADGDRIVGIISLRDLMTIDLQQKSAEIQMMHAYLHYVPPVVG